MEYGKLVAAALVALLVGGAVGNNLGKASAAKAAAEAANASQAAAAEAFQNGRASGCTVALQGLLGPEVECASVSGKLHARGAIVRNGDAQIER